MQGKAFSMRRGSRNGDAVQRRRVFVTVCATVLMLSLLTIYYSSFFNSRFHAAHVVGAGDNDPSTEITKVGINRHVHQQTVDIHSSRENEVIDLKTKAADSESHLRQVDKEQDEDKEDFQDEAETEDAETGTDDLKDEVGTDEVTLRSFPVSDADSTLELLFCNLWMLSVLVAINSPRLYLSPLLAHLMPSARISVFSCWCRLSTAFAIVGCQRLRIATANATKGSRSLTHAMVAGLQPRVLRADSLPGPTDSEEAQIEAQYLGNGAL